MSERSRFRAGNFSHLALSFLLQERLKSQKGQLDELEVILGDRDVPLRYKTSLTTIVYGIPKAWRFPRVFVSSKNEIFVSY